MINTPVNLVNCLKLQGFKPQGLELLDLMIYCTWPPVLSSLAKDQMQEDLIVSKMIKLTES